MPSIVVTTLTPEAIDNFLSSLRGLGRSAQTEKAYESDLKIFLKEMGNEPVSMEEFAEMGLTWLQIHRRVLAPKTTRRRATSLRAFANWAKWDDSDLRNFIAPTPADEEPRPLPEGLEGIERLLAATDNEKKRALVALCGLCGLRVGEALQVKPSHFSLQEMVLRVFGKGDRQRIVPISPRAWSILAVPVGRAFVEGDREVVAYKDRYARRVVTELGIKACLRRQIASHDLRATFATMMWEKTKDLLLVQILMGHANAKTTQRYVGIQMQKMREAVDL